MLPCYNFYYKYQIGGLCMKKIIPLFTLLIIIAFSSMVYAHPGRTDENGGHYDRSTGEYHYHHGYPAHQHENGVCPYDFDDKTNHSDINSTISSDSSNNSSNFISFLEEYDFITVLIIVLKFIILATAIIFLPLFIIKKLLQHNDDKSDGHEPK